MWARKLSRKQTHWTSPLSNDDQSRLNRWSRLAGGLPAGVVDAGFASLGSFAAGLAAVNLLSETDLGVYAVFFAAFIVGTAFPHNLAYLPSQIYAVGRPMSEKLLYIGRLSSLGIVFSMLGSLAILAAAVATAAHTSTSVTIALTVTAVLNLVVSAAQDNLRRMLHIGGLHWSAASMSIVQFISVAIVLLMMIARDAPVAWIPFGSLICANIVSSTLGLIRAGGCAFIVVLGHPEYYPRFGFKRASTLSIRCQWEVPDEAFMVLVLDEPEMQGVSGLAEYREEFSRFG